MHRLRELRGVRSPTTTSIPLQTSDYRALQQKDLELEEEDSGDALAQDTRHISELQHVDNGFPRTRLSTLTSITATPWVVHLLLTLLNLFTFAYLLQKGPSDAACMKSLSSWSPAIDAGIVRYKTIPIEQENTLNKGLSSAEVDATWTNITSAVPKLRITATELGRLKRKPTENAVYQDEAGYVAQLEVFELLGCLDRIRRANNKWQDQAPKERPRRSDEEFLDQEDLTACIDILRVEVMCLSDVDLVTYKEDKGSLRADHSGVKKCRGFDDILDWSYNAGKKVDLSTDS